MADIVIIGGGAAGMMAAIAARRADKENTNQVTLLEKNEKLGKKLFITGKGRCNVTNACETEELFSNVMEHAKFLYSAIYGFDNQAVMNFFEEKGCPLKIERGQRVFPESDHSSDIIRALEQELKRTGVRVLLNREVKKINFRTLGQKETEDVKTSKKKQKQTAEVLNIEFFDKTTSTTNKN